MKLLYYLLPLVSSALADDLIKCPCSQQDCAKAEDVSDTCTCLHKPWSDLFLQSCACYNTNLVNKYFCCDGGVDAAKDLGLRVRRSSYNNMTRSHLLTSFRTARRGSDQSSILMTLIVTRSRISVADLIIFHVLILRTTATIVASMIWMFGAFAGVLMT